MTEKRSDTQTCPPLRQVSFGSRARALVLTLFLLLLLLPNLDDASATPTRRRSRAHLLTVTGTYKQGYKDLGSELVVQEQSGKRIRSSLYSFWRCPDGTLTNGFAEESVELKGRTAIYKQTDPAYPYVLTLRFSPAACVVDCDKPGHFGGFNVDPTGSYKKVSSRARFN